MKLIALDLDGTLLTSEKSITTRTAKALTEASCAGMLPVIVTGRPFTGLPQAVMEIPGIRYVITSNGAVTTDLADNSRLNSFLIDSETAMQIAAIPMERGLVYNIFMNGTGYCDPDSYRLLRSVFDGTILEPYVKKSRKPVDDIFRLLQQEAQGVENIWIMGRDQAERDELGAMIRQYPHLQTMYTAVKDVEVGTKESGKGNALLGLASLLGIDRRDILAIGDNQNDLDMLLAAGTSVAMGNATTQIKAMAACVTDTNDEDGVAKVLEHYLSL